jgi:hypothetical protein
LVAADVTGLAEPERDSRVFEELRKDHPQDFGEIDILEHATFREFSDHLSTRSYNIVHFSGTGVRTSKMPMLSVFDERGGTLPVEAEMLLQMLQKQSELRAVFLSADYTDQVAKLLSHSVPVCIGIRELVSAQSAATFARTLYYALLAGLPVSQALTRARQDLDSQNPGVRDWALITAYAAEGSIRKGMPQSTEGWSPEETRITIPQTGSTDRRRLKVEREIALHQANLGALESQKVSRHSPEWRELESQIATIRSTIEKLREELRKP